ncbi:fructosamine kinase family protein [Edwardsiella piscicida]|uniref:fructosamine kinase family protein n=1 Tax=Edwardsiella piscicida TaxID=1263550 RepID=UPI001CEC7AFD|nr:fructosamine kinase family protein [Edwardsiella piscicida]AOP42881.2 fructosamine kinase family protein [Edwardsiella piscicida]UCQ58991.1 fructosamine kinase family protein [Edwardsiella piscicida]
MWQAVSRLLTSHFNQTFTLRERQELPGGAVHRAWRIGDGERSVFVKCDTPDVLHSFQAEADQLALLARSGTVQTPAVYGVGSTRDASFLLLEYLPVRPLDAHHAYLLGQQLARLHRWSEQPQFGLDTDNLLATSPQPNAWQRRWATFFAEQRIGWQLQLAAEKGITFGDIDEIVERVRRRLQDHQPRPSLLHGDLWPDNMGLSAKGPVLFDPACYWGDRECDLAMLPLSPQLPPQIYDGYQSVWPLPADFIARQPLYQLYHRLNQCNLYGGSHLAQTEKAIEALGHETPA